MLVFEYPHPVKTRKIKGYMAIRWRGGDIFI